MRRRGATTRRPRATIPPTRRRPRPPDGKRWRAKTAPRVPRALAAATTPQRPARPSARRLAALLPTTWRAARRGRSGRARRLARARRVSRLPARAESSGPKTGYRRGRIPRAAGCAACRSRTRSNRVVPAPPGRTAVKHRARARTPRRATGRHRRSRVRPTIGHCRPMSRHVSRAALTEPAGLGDRLAERALQGVRCLRDAALAQRRPAAFDAPHAQRATGKHNPEDEAGQRRRQCQLESRRPQRERNGHEARNRCEGGPHGGITAEPLGSRQARKAARDYDVSLPLHLSVLTPEAVRAALARDARLLVPVGTCEQHGPHLPLGCDTYIVERLADD